MNKKRIILLISLSAVFGTLAFVLDRFISFPIPLLGVSDGLKITFYPLVLIVISIIISKEAGLLSGIITAVLSQLIFPQWGITLTTPLWMIPYLVWGLLPGLINSIKKDNNSIIKLILSILITSILVSLLNSLILILDGKINGYPVEFTISILFIRLLSSFIMSCIYIPITYFLRKIIKK